jgi:hypothetical protein
MKRKPIKPVKRRRAPSGPAAVDYQPRERMIFRYFNGTKTTAGDPLRIQRELLSHPGDLDTDVKLLFVSLPQAQPKVREAFERVVATVRRAFNLELFDGERGAGLTDQECVDLFSAFCNFIAELKKKAGISLTRSPTVSFPVDESVIESTSASSSTAPAPSTDKPPQSQSASA